MLKPIFHSFPSDADQLVSVPEMFVFNNDVIQTPGKQCKDGGTYNFWPKIKNRHQGDEVGWIIPAAMESLMYFSIASLSGLNKLYSLFNTRGSSGSSSMAQSKG